MHYDQLAAMSREELLKAPCECVSCATCRGTGIVWFAFGGRYLGRNRSDDLDEMEACHDCGGGGITESCDRCNLLRDDEA